MRRNALGAKGCKKKAYRSRQQAHADKRVKRLPQDMRAVLCKKHTTETYHLLPPN